MELWVAVNAILERPQLRRDRRLWEQISDANDSIPSNMREGFEQGSDEAFAKYLVYAKGSVAEVVTRLHEAHLKRYVTLEELTLRVTMGEELGKMLGGFIKYLRRCGFKDRGSYRLKHPEAGTDASTNDDPAPSASQTNDSETNDSETSNAPTEDSRTGDSG
jgi:four helix bundle protein